jgi:hypothetical protein
MTILTDFIEELNSPTRLRFYVAITDLDIATKINTLNPLLRDVNVKTYLSSFYKEEIKGKATIIHLVGLTQPDDFENLKVSYTPDFCLIFWLTSEEFKNLSTLSPSLYTEVMSKGGIYNLDFKEIGDET